ncbi:MAG: YceI family protein [Longimicrobiales bacterium]
MINYRLGTTLVAGMALTLIAATPLRTALTLQPESRIWVSGKSSVKDFKCEAKAIDANVSSPPQQKDLGLPKLVSDAEIAITVAGLECGNGTMNGHMRKALKIGEFPRIVFKLSNYAVTGGDIIVNGNLTMAGKSLPVELKGKVTDGDGVVRSTATADIDMTKWGVKPPSLMLGTMKVKPVATIGYDIAMKR